MSEDKPAGVPEDALTMEQANAQELADCEAAYKVLLNELLGKCGGSTPGIAIAAAMSAAFCVATDSVPEQSTATNYLTACFYDALKQLPAAYAEKAKAEVPVGGNDNGSDTGEEG